jgi:hypothetical protein
MDKGYLLEEDKARIVQRAAKHGFDMWHHPLPR